MNPTSTSCFVRRFAFAAMIAAGLAAPAAFSASTPGGAKLTATINPLSGSNGEHYTVVWVTDASNVFITTLWKQGKASFTHSNWIDHFPTWETQRGTSTALPAAPDGYTSATTFSYAATNPSPPASGVASNPITITWNGKDANGTVVPDGTYKFWIEYGEESGTHGVDGPLTTGGLTWTKGPSAFSVSPANQGTNGSPSGGFNFTAMSIVWTPSVVTPSVSVAVAPASVTEDGATNMVYTFTRSSSTGTLAVSFSVGGTATFGTDYTQSGAATFSASSGTVNFASGSATATVTIDPTADSTVESNETVVLTVVAGSGYTVGAPSAATGTITNDDTAYSSWASVLPAGQNGPSQTPQNDGVTNLMKFACNLDPTKPDVRVLTVGGNGLAGLPGKAIVGGKLRMEFLRRKAINNPGITYTPQFSSTVGSWIDFAGTPTVTSIDTTWERVVVDDTVSGAERFGRLKVVQSP